jgi:hypothetical protein
MSKTLPTMKLNDNGPVATMEVSPSGSLFKKAKNKFSQIRKMTLRKLNQYKQTGKCIAVSAEALGEGKFISFVEDIYQAGLDEIVVLKWFDKNNLASKTHLFIEEILSVDQVDKRYRSDASFS